MCYWPGVLKGSLDALAVITHLLHLLLLFVVNAGRRGLAPLGRVQVLLALLVGGLLHLHRDAVGVGVWVLPDACHLPGDLQAW